MSTRSESEQPALIESLRYAVEDYERQIRLIDTQMRVLEKERQKLSAVVNNTDAGFLVIGADLKLVWANRIFPGLFNAASHSALLGQPCNKVVCRRDEVCEICPAAQALRTGQVAHHEVHLEAEAGTRHIYATSIPIKSPDGSIEETMVMLQDVSDLGVLLREKGRVQLLQEVAVAANEAQTVEEAFKTCLDRICSYMGWPVGHVYLVADEGADALLPTRIWHLDQPERFETFRRVTEASPMARGTGLPGRVLESGTGAWITDVNEDPNFPRRNEAGDIGVKAGFGFPVMVGKEVVAVLEFFCPDALPPDPQLLEVMRHIGTQLGRVMERDRASRALRQSEEQLRHAQKMEAVGRLAGGVAHDFNNLLTVITGHSELLLAHHGGQGSSDKDDYVTKELEEIRRAAQRAAALTKQLLAFSRKQVLQPRLIDLNAAVNDMETMLRRLIGEDILLVTELGADPGSVKADRGQIEQVIMNLAVNARDAMPTGGRITLRTERVDLATPSDAIEPGSYILLQVRDTGRGMDAETLARVFEPFFTTKEQGKGTGLGLSTVYGIVRQSGGHVLVESEPGQGATFSIYLPRVEAPAPSADLKSAAPATLTGNETILLVEDELVVRHLAHEILKRRGYQVLEARDPADARLICERHEGRIHMMLTDVVMPMMSGIELADYLTPIRPDMKVLFMSGYTDENLVLDETDAGTTAFIQKPFTPDTLAERIRELLDSRPGL